MEKTMAVLDSNNKVVNIIVGDENSPTIPGTRLVEVLSNQYCDFGYTFDGQNFLNTEGVICVYENQ